MTGRQLVRMALGLGLVLGAAGPASAQVGYGPGAFRVESWGYYDRYPYPPAAGPRVLYSSGRPWVTYYDPRLGWVDGPLQPKVLYSGAPLPTPQGYYTPRSMTVYPNDRPAPLPPPATRPAAPEPARSAPAPAKPADPSGTFRYDGGPARPVPDVAPDLAPPKAAELGKPPVPKVPDLPPVPPVPGVPKLGPSPMDIPAGPPK